MQTSFQKCFIYKIQLYRFRMVRQGFIFVTFFLVYGTTLVTNTLVYSDKLRLKENILLTVDRKNLITNLD